MQYILEELASALEAAIYSKPFSDELSAFSEKNQDIGEVFSSKILEKFLPKHCTLGPGIIVDSFGAVSEKVSIVLARNDFPVLFSDTGSRIYLIESVLAVFHLEYSLNEKSLVNALEKCASVSNLRPKFQEDILDCLVKNNFVEEREGHYFHPDSLTSARFPLMFLPSVYILGIQSNGLSPEKARETLDAWIEESIAKKKGPLLQFYPSIIVFGKYIACRNADILKFSPLDRGRVPMLITKDINPFRIVIRHIFFTIFSKITLPSDAREISQGLHPYLSMMRPTYMGGMILPCRPLLYDVGVTRKKIQG